MTREEAIKILRKEIECLSHTKCEDCILEAVCDPIKTTPYDSEYIEAYGMAIKALEQEPKTGHWIEDDMTYCGVELVNYKCDKCGEMGGAWRKGLKPDKLPKYCMNCGAKMLPTDSEKE